MIRYFFSFLVDTNMVEVKLIIPAMEGKKLDLHLPTWRPGRYQLQNFAKNILNFSAQNAAGNLLPWRKTQKNVWRIESAQNQEVEVSYKYFAKELNAGSSMVNGHFVYINPVNLCLYLPEKIDVAFEVVIAKNVETDKIACGLEARVSKKGFVLNPHNFHHFFDSPFIVSSSIVHQNFEVGEYSFHLWIQGKVQIEIEKLVADLAQIAHSQIAIFGEFPEKDYHFMLIVPESTYYHGVEHRNSTMMVLGENNVLPLSYYNDLLGLASHELFHAWNIAKIRPKELLPYNYDKENYFETCFVAEGFTTYYGDKILLQSEVITHQEYLHELETTCRRHFEEADFAYQSLLESSFDLWVDGYEKGTPNKKVSVYSKGAIVALILDIKIRRKFKEKKSLDDVMRLLWKRFGGMKKGYSYKDIQEICEKVYGASLREYFELAIEGNQPIFDYTNLHLAYLGLTLVWKAERCTLV
jgi:predicted metalloprotease with PDZ domain